MFRKKIITLNYFVCFRDYSETLLSFDAEVQYYVKFYGQRRTYTLDIAKYCYYMRVIHNYYCR